MNEKLKNRPVENDTKVLGERYYVFDDTEFVVEEWYWDGIFGASAVFLEEQVGEMDDEELKSFVFSAMQLPVDPQTTIKRDSDGYTFVNFSFDAD